MDQNRDAVHGNISLGMEWRKPAQLSERALKKEIWPMDFKKPVQITQFKAAMRSKYNNQVEYTDNQ